MSINLLLRLGEWVKVFNDTVCLSIRLWFTTADDAKMVFSEYSDFSKQ
jgi:hypothetical protein